MPFELHNRPDFTVEISAHLSPEAVEEERIALLKQLRRTVRIPGFRPGKAPLAVVRARVGAEIQEDLEERLARRLWHEVLSESEIDPISDLRVNRVELDEDGTFRLEGVVDIRPEFELPDPAGAELPEVSVEPTDAEVDEEIERLAEQQAAWEPSEEPAADGMIAEVVVTGTVEDDPDAEPVDLGELTLLIGRETLGSEVDAALQGASPKDVREATATFPEEHPDPRLAGHTVAFKLEVKALRKKVLPEIDDEFARSVGAEDVDDLRAKVREALTGRKKAERRRTWRRAVLDHLEKALDPANLPPSVVEAALKDALDGVAFNMVMQGIDPGSSEIDWQRIAGEAEPEARKNALDRLVLEQLAAEWEVAVPEEDVEAYIRQEAARQSVPPGEFRARLEAEGRIPGIRQAARITKVVDRLIEMAGGEVD